MMRELLTYPTWERYTVLADVIGRLTMRERRVIFQLMRQVDPPSTDVFFPRLGFTLAEFAVWHILGSRRTAE